ncbi:hypothetical protein MBA34_16690 [Pseudomonas capeferrum]|uniref:hypothetical protein n=1 Tax=Pseudomonas capeferrum TaxID=1495066 RepID=UPI0004D34258|nr:hypothetical protein [Pseudomonas capeferrum]KEY87494.1 hypothetical protein PC358_17750 [Pseudomonas capeferrum]MCH7300657.1 hypothetical protein [Pseudomonas capeferrum]
MKAKEKKEKTLNEALRERRLHLIEINNLAIGDYKTFSKVQLLSIESNNAMIECIETQLERGP